MDHREIISKAFSEDMLDIDILDDGTIEFSWEAEYDLSGLLKSLKEEDWQDWWTTVVMSAAEEATSDE